MSATTSGYLLIADITGYTAYLSESELEHAQGTLTALLEVLLAHTKAPLVLSRLAGDAVISYALGDAFTTGQTFLELVEDTYVAFKKAVDRMVMNNTCTCTACARVGTLDLKFFVHHGTFARQKLSTQEELVGNDVNLIHRLLKNKVIETTGIHAYALYTDAAIKALGVGGLTQSMTAHEETYEHVGSVKVWIADMGKVWERRKATQHEALGPMFWEGTTDIAEDAATVWSFLTVPEHLRRLLGTDKVGVDGTSAGRVDVGTVYQCFHGERITPLSVIEWKPFERLLTESVNDMKVSHFILRAEYQLEPTPTGTKLIQRFAQPTGPWLGRTLGALMFKTLLPKVQKNMEVFKAEVESTVAGRTARPNGVTIARDEVQAAARESAAASAPSA